MKKLILMVSVTIVAFASCNRSAGPSASLKTDVDTLSYELGMANSRGLKQYLAERMGVDTTYMDEFYKGLAVSAQSGDDKKKAAYYAGIQIGQQLGTQMYKGINTQLFGKDSTKTISLRNLISGFIAGTKGKDQKIPMSVVEKEIQSRMQVFIDKNMTKVYGANKDAGAKFMQSNKNKPGVKTTASGLQYKVIKEGNGPIPTDTSKVLVSYEGRLISGTVFDSSYRNNNGKPIEVQVNQMIPGWIEALTHMPEGSIWEIYVPQQLAYGSREAGDKVKPYSTLIFKLELVKVK
ncbi:MAG: FKBP-type peptidyl-prolyl cis-trans isomerase [Bacteroidaceae bacterium]|jgi:FKBP-type peptidyl-prolyl cis-trans isomerase FklB|nr:FKBP-type peptidyl-prolyl cis-trans isomerase [Bacteroidaceae bacterium]